MEICGTAVFSLSKKRNFACGEVQEDMNYEGNASRGSSLSKKKRDDNAFATTRVSCRHWKKKASGALRKERLLQG